MKILALGSNLRYKNNSPIKNIELAYKCIEKFDIKIINKSNIYKSEPYPNKFDPFFFNSVISINTNLKPFELLKNILEIEKFFGRIRKKKELSKNFRY